MATSEAAHRKSAEEALSTLRAQTADRLANPELLPPGWKGRLQDLLQAIDSTPAASLSDEALASLVREAGNAVEITGRYPQLVGEVDLAADEPGGTIGASDDRVSRTRRVEGPGWEIGGPGGRFLE